MNSQPADAITPELHQQLLRMHCEQPLTPAAALERCGISLLQFTAWLRDQRTRDDLAALRFSADFSMHMFMGQQRLSAITKLMEISREGSGETARRASKDLLNFHTLPPPKPAAEPPPQPPPPTGAKAEILRHIEGLQLASLPRFNRPSAPGSSAGTPGTPGSSSGTLGSSGGAFNTVMGIVLLGFAACLSLSSGPGRTAYDRTRGGIGARPASSVLDLAPASTSPTVSATISPPPCARLTRGFVLPTQSLSLLKVDSS